MKLAPQVFMPLCFSFVFAGANIANAERPIRGVYEVPVADPSLAAFSQYPVRFKSDNYGADATEMTFPMPSTLMGEETQFTIRRDPENHQVFRGENVEGTCAQIDRELQCRLQFKNLSIDPLKVESSIQSQFLKPSEIEARKAVAKTFSHELQGILKYRLRGGDRNSY